MWPFSLEDSLRVVQPHLARLTSPASMEQVLSVGRHFPDSIGASYGFEFRLDDPHRAVDFAIHITGADRRWMADLYSHSNSETFFATDPDWQRIGRFSRAWADPSSVLHYLVRDLWLEFDLSPHAGSGLPVPRLFFSPSGPGTRVGDDGRYRWISQSAAPLLWGKPASPGLQQRLDAFLQGLPPDASVFQVGLIVGQPAVVRLCIVGQTEDVLSYLTSVGWTAPLREIRAVIASVSPYVDGIVFDIDVGEHLYPRIGIEGVYHSLYTACVNGQWRDLLDHLVAEKLCAQRDRDALLDFVGYEVEKRLYHRIYVRGLSHFKLDYQPGKPMKAKVYLGATHRPLNVVPGFTGPKLAPNSSGDSCCGGGASPAA